MAINEQAGSGEAFTRAAVTVILALIAMLTFAFSFGNIWALGLHLGVSPWISPLVGPAADLSVIGLPVALRYLSLRGVDGRRLRPARCLLVFTGVATLTLNVAEPVAQGTYGRAAFDAVGPLLLIGWAEVGPGLLRQIHAVRTGPPLSEPDCSASERPTESARPIGADETRASGRTESSRKDKLSGSRRPRQSDSRGRKRPSSRRRRDHAEPQLLARARRIDAEHRSKYGRPVSADTLRGELHVGSARARQLVAMVRTASRDGGIQNGESVA